MATTSTSDSTPWTSRRVRERPLAAGASWSAVTGALPRAGPGSSLARTGSSCLLGVELESSVRALAEGRLEGRAAGEAQHLGGLAGELPVGVSGQVQPAGHTATGELVVPCGGELAGGRLDPLEVPHPLRRRRALYRPVWVAGGGQPHHQRGGAGP